MKPITKKRIIYLSFIIVLLLTLIIFNALLQANISYSQTNDDILGSKMDVFIGIVFLIPIILAEIDIFYTIKYLLLQQLNKNKYRTLINIISCSLSIFIIIALLFCMLWDHFFSIYINYNIFCILLWVWGLIFLLVRGIYCIILRIKNHT